MGSNSTAAITTGPYLVGMDIYKATPENQPGLFINKRAAR